MTEISHPSRIAQCLCGLLISLSYPAALLADELELVIKEGKTWKDHSVEIQKIKNDVSALEIAMRDTGHGVSGTSDYFEVGFGNLYNEFRFPHEDKLKSASRFLWGDIGKPLLFTLNYRNESGKAVSILSLDLVVDDFEYHTSSRGEGMLELESLSLERVPQYLFLNWPEGHLQTEHKAHLDRKGPLPDKVSYSRTTGTFSSPITLGAGESQEFQIQTNTKPYQKSAPWGSSHILLHLEIVTSKGVIKSDAIYLIGNQTWMVGAEEE